MESAQENNSCRLCGARDQQIIRDNLVSKYRDSFSLKKCKSCSYVSTHPVPSNQLLRRYYDRNYWQSGRLKKSVALTAFYKWRMAGIVSYIRQNSKSGNKILDWGCGDGSFVKLLRSHGYECYGLDAYAAEPDVPYIINATIEKPGFAEDFFDIITCFHVLEHLKKPKQSIANAFKILKTNGVMIVEVPNFDSLGSRIFRNRWQPLQIPTHISHFTPETLHKLSQSVGQDQIVKTEFFSHRISPSALVLSVFPSLSPKRIREKYKGRFPLTFGITYLILQLLAYPFAIFGSLIRHGEIVRIYVRKSAR
jgi:2-polyprenyl-3-methyl-5-hydroxy-6-metoxy-1,4-benzoquinol methylase